MKKQIVLMGLLMLSLMTFAKTPSHYYIKIKTDKGTAILKLYNETPLHRDNFHKLVREKYYDSLLFHRVINHFMIQGGDPDSRYAGDRSRLGNGGPKETIPAEFHGNLIHKRGTIGAARDNNPEKSSSGSQFYLVQGRTFSQAGLDSLETYRLKGKKLTPQQREAYATVGGTPHLDGDYTVFGELVTGDAILDKIAAVAKDEYDRPMKNERMAMEVLMRREALNLERELNGLKAKNGFFTKLADSFRSRFYSIK